MTVILVDGNSEVQVNVPCALPEIRIPEKRPAQTTWSDADSMLTLGMADKLFRPTGEQRFRLTQRGVMAWPIYRRIR
jgi:hypothetical protein